VLRVITSCAVLSPDYFESKQHLQHVFEVGNSRLNDLIRVHPSELAADQPLRGAKRPTAPREDCLCRRNADRRHWERHDLDAIMASDLDSYVRE
jgi:hypothetical protein